MELVTSDSSDEIEVTPSVYLSQLAAGNEMSVQRVRMEPDGRVPEHEHYHEQLGFVYQGDQTFILKDGTEITACSGDSYWLKSHEAHAAENQGDKEMLAIDIFSPPRHTPNWPEN